MPDLTGPLDRPRAFALAFVLLAANGAVTLAATAVHARGWWASVVNLFEISAILWCAAVAGAAILLAAPRDRAPRRWDIAVLALAAAAALPPFPALSAAALSGLCLWAIVTSERTTPVRRAALIFLAVTTSLLWGRLILALGSDVFLAGEGAMVSLVTGSAGTANTVAFAGGDRFFTVAPGCSSLQGVSLAVVLWVAVTQYFQMTLTPRLWATLAGMVTVTVAVNVARLSAISLFPDHFDSLHGGLGASMFGWAAFLGILAVMAIGARDALAARA